MRAGPDDGQDVSGRPSQSVHIRPGRERSGEAAASALQVARDLVWRCDLLAEACTSTDLMVGMPGRTLRPARFLGPGGAPLSRNCHTPTDRPRAYGLLRKHEGIIPPCRPAPGVLTVPSWSRGCDAYFPSLVLARPCRRRRPRPSCRPPSRPPSRPARGRPSCTSRSLMRPSAWCPASSGRTSRCSTTASPCPLSLFDAEARAVLGGRHARYQRQHDRQLELLKDGGRAVRHPPVPQDKGRWAPSTTRSSSRLSSRPTGTRWPARSSDLGFREPDPPLRCGRGRSSSGGRTKGARSCSCSPTGTTLPARSAWGTRSTTPAPRR